MQTLLLMIMILIIIIPRLGHAQSGGEAVTVEQLQDLQRELEALRGRLESLEQDFAAEQEIAAKTLVGGYIQTTFTDFSTGQILTHFKMDICERLSHRMHHSTAMTT